MSLVPYTRISRIREANRELKRELERELSLLEPTRPRFFPPYEFNVYPYHWDDPRIWWPSVSSLRHPMDDIVTQRVRNQLIQSAGFDNWSHPLRWMNTDPYSGETVHVDENGFRVDIDMSQFRPHEIDVRTTDDYVIVEGNHAKRKDTLNNSYVERHLLRKYLLPHGYNTHNIISDLSNDGILTIKAPPPTPPRRQIQQPSLRYSRSPSERYVHVHPTGRPALTWK